MQWQTEITHLLGCKYPVLQGAVVKIGAWQLAATVAGVPKIQSVRKLLVGMMADAEKLLQERRLLTD